MDALEKTYLRLHGMFRTDWTPDPERDAEFAAELEALIRYRQATHLAAHNGMLKASDPSSLPSGNPFWRAGVPLGAAAEDARKWLARAHKAISDDTLTILRAVVLEDQSLDQARKRVERCSLGAAEHMLRNAADSLRDL